MAVSLERRRKRKEMEGGADLQDLPEGCISTILSFTTPKDACRSATISCMFNSAAKADNVWHKFLPSDYQEILSRSWEEESLLQLSSKKELYFRLCDYILMDGGKKCFKLEKSTGRKCYMLGARQLSIVWADNHHYWGWEPCSHSRFSEVAILRVVWWLEMCGRVDTRMLSLGTTYTAYLIVKFGERWKGLGSQPTEVTLEVGNHVARNIALICPDRSMISPWGYLYPEEEVKVPNRRADGWMEIELGDFYNDVGDHEVTIRIENLKNCREPKRGLIVEGIEVRPKY